MDIKRIRQTDIRQVILTMLDKIRSGFSSDRHEKRVESDIIGKWSYCEKIKIDSWQKNAIQYPWIIDSYFYSFYDNGTAELVYTDNRGHYERSLFQYNLKGNVLHTKHEEDHYTEKYCILLEEDILEIKLSNRQSIQLKRVWNQ